jgi:DDE family transposase/transposase IS4-like protein
MALRTHGAQQQGLKEARDLGCRADRAMGGLPGLDGVTGLLVGVWVSKSMPVPGALVPSYLPVADPASPVAAGLPAGMVAIRTADLQIRSGGRGAVLAGAAVAAGTMVTFCHPVVTVPAVIRRGAALAGGWLPDFVRLGELERHLGEGVIEELAAKAAAGGRMPPRQRKRIMSYPLTIRLTVAMTLMPDASYAEALRRLAGLLAEVPFAREWHVPGSKVITCWRGMLPPSVLEELFWRAAGPLVAAGAPSAVMLAGLPVCAIDGMLVAVAGTPANRKAFGCAGTSREHGTGAAPFPHIQAVLVTARAGRATLGAIIGRARAGEQTLLARLIRRRPELFHGRVFVFDRNFPGHAIITAILDAGGHVVARIKDGISLPATEGGWLADGSRISYLNAQSGKKGDRLPVRVAEHNVVLPLGDGQQVSETCTLATTLLDHRLASAEQIRDAYRMRWSASETTFGEDKTALAGAGDRTSGPVLRSGSPRLVVQEFWAWLTATQLVRASAAAALDTGAAATHALRQREGSGPVTTDQVSFTTARHHAIRSMTWSQVTAATSLPGMAAAADAAASAALHTLITTGRQRHSPRAQKARPRFPHTASTKKTVTGIPQITRFAPRPP